MMDLIKKLRDKTSAGVVDCKKALKEANGDIDKAIEVLRKRGAVLAPRCSMRPNARWDGTPEFEPWMGFLTVRLETAFSCTAPPTYASIIRQTLNRAKSAD